MTQRQRDFAGDTSFITIQAGSACRKTIFILVHHLFEAPTQLLAAEFHWDWFTGFLVTQ